MTNPIYPLLCTGELGAKNRLRVFVLPTTLKPLGEVSTNSMVVLSRYFDDLRNTI